MYIYYIYIYIHDVKRSDPCVLWCDAVSLDMWFPTFRHTAEHLTSNITVATTSNLVA